jgi:hypothetical protein
LGAVDVRAIVDCTPTELIYFMHINNKTTLKPFPYGVQILYYVYQEGIQGDGTALSS